MKENIDFGQHGCYFGYYLGILATEYQLLVSNNRILEAQCDLSEAQLALNQFIDYMDKCEHYFGDCSSDPKYCDIYNGFFIRTGVSEDYLDSNNIVGRTLPGDIPHLKILNQDLMDSDIWNEQFKYGQLPRGHPGWLKDVESKITILARISYDAIGSQYYGYQSMSQDDAIGILLGLALVYKYVPSLSSMAADIADNILLKISNGDSWIIPAPNKTGGTEGFNALSYAFGFAEAGQFFGFIPFRYIPPGSIFCTNFQLKRDVWLGIATQTNVPIANCAMECTLGAIGDSWGWYFGPCTTIPQISNTMSAIYNKCIGSFYQTADPPGIRTFYCILLNRLHPERDLTDEILNDTYSQLSQAPFEGPYFYNTSHNSGIGGWAYSYAWHGNYNDNYGILSTNTAGNFSGMDYMLLYNLYVLASNDITPGSVDITGYYPRINVRLGENWPIKFVNEVHGDINSPERFIACNYIESDSKIRNSVRYDEQQRLLPENQQIISPGDISYVAKKIKLKPGFCVEQTSRFHVKSISHVFWDAGFENNTKFYSQYGLVNPSFFGCWYDYHFLVASPNENSFTFSKGFQEIKTNFFDVKQSCMTSNDWGFNVYPNPATTKITIELSVNTLFPMEFTLTNTYGQQLLKQKLTQPISVIDIQDIANGIYIFQTHIFGKGIIRKLIKL